MEGFEPTITDPKSDALPLGYIQKKNGRRRTRTVISRFAILCTRQIILPGTTGFKINPVLGWT
jgi:hypothetical protein